jgi:hypothetical protein
MILRSVLVAALLAAPLAAFSQNTIVNSLIFKGDNGSRVTLTAPPGLSGNLSVALPIIPTGGTLLGTDATGNLLMGAGDFIQLTEPAGAGGTNWTRLQAGSQASDFTWTLPTTAPTANQVLTATAIAGGDVTLGWTTPSGGGGGSTVTTGYSKKTANQAVATLAFTDVTDMSISWGTTPGTYKVEVIIDATLVDPDPGMTIQFVELGSAPTFARFYDFTFASIALNTAYEFYALSATAAVVNGKPYKLEGYVTSNGSTTGVKLQARQISAQAGSISLTDRCIISYTKVN